MHERLPGWLAALALVLFVLSPFGSLPHLHTDEVAQADCSACIASCSALPEEAPLALLDAPRAVELTGSLSPVIATAEAPFFAAPLACGPPA